MCECSELPDIFKLESHPGFNKQRPRIAEGNWFFLHQCHECGQQWRVDAWDKYHTQFVVRIPEGTDGHGYDDTPLRKSFLVASQGGLKAEQCQWRGCTRPQVKGEVVYCVEHLYQTGARE